MGDSFPLDHDRVFDEAHQLISSRRVEGTPVWNKEDGRLGTIHSLMINKRIGEVAFAVLSVRNALGLKEELHPVAWDTLSYDPAFETYLLDISYAQLISSPKLEPS